MQRPITELLASWSDGDAEAADQLIPLVYDHLHSAARRLMRDERAHHTLQATALVHEAYARLHESERPQWQSRQHFLSVAALVMRRVLVDHARSLGRRKRGGDFEVLSLEGEAVVAPERAAALLDLDEALERLARVDSRKAKVVELKFFGGLSLPEIARILQIGNATVSRDWRMARAWLADELAAEDPP